MRSTARQVRPKSSTKFKPNYEVLAEPISRPASGVLQQPSQQMYTPMQSLNYRPTSHQISELLTPPRRPTPPSSLMQLQPPVPPIPPIRPTPAPAPSSLMQLQSHVPPVQSTPYSPSMSMPLPYSKILTSNNKLNELIKLPNGYDKIYAILKLRKSLSKAKKNEIDKKLPELLGKIPPADRFRIESTLNETYGKPVYKDEFVPRLMTSLSTNDRLISNIIRIRKQLKNAPSKSLIKSVYAFSSSREKNTKEQKIANNKLSKNIAEINKKIIERIGKSSKDDRQPIESNIYNIYKNNSNTNKKAKLLKALREKNIDRTVSHVETKNYRWFRGNTVRSAVDVFAAFGKVSGLSSAASFINKHTGISKVMPTIPTGLKEHVKLMKADVQILKKQLATTKEQDKIDEIQKQIDMKKARIKQITGVNYNNNAENYETVMSKNSSNNNFDLNAEYNKLLYKKSIIDTLNSHPKIIYKELLTKNNNIRNTVSLNNNLFKKDNKLFSKFSSSVPYSEYNFLYGIDKHSKLDEERLVALLYMTKIIFTIFLEPHYIVPVTAAVIGLLLSRFALDYYRKVKRSIEKNIIFCIKYFPFVGIEHFASELISKYHKIFYYDMSHGTENQTNQSVINSKQNIEFYESVIELTEKEENDFIEKNILFVKYLNEYETAMNNNFIKSLEVGLKTTNARLQKNGYQSIESAIAPQIAKEQQKSAAIEEKAKEEQSNAELQSEIYGTPASTHNIYRQSEVSTHVPAEQRLSNHQEGGANLKILVDNRNYIKYGKLIPGKSKKVDKKFTERFSSINKAVFRLNHIIYQNDEPAFILTSGNISIQYLFLELKPIINSRATFFEGELKPLSKSIPFFTNDYLTNLLDTIAAESTKYGAITSTRMFMIDFIKEYIDSFLKLYELAKYNILLLLKNKNSDDKKPDDKKPDDKKSYDKDLLLKELFKANLSYTMMGRYGFTSSPGERELTEIKYRDILNYYCILLKYCQISLDHIHKRFKISIIPYNKNNKKIYDANNNAEIEFTKTLDKKLKDSFSGKYTFKSETSLNPYSSTSNIEIKQFDSSNLPGVVQGLQSLGSR